MTNTVVGPHSAAYNAAAQYLADQGVGAIIGDTVAGRIADSVADYTPEWLAEAQEDAEWRSGWAGSIRADYASMRMPPTIQIANAIRVAAAAVEQAGA
jgi:hypothetical protein